MTLDEKAWIIIEAEKDYANKILAQDKYDALLECLLDGLTEEDIFALNEKIEKLCEEK